jgi:GAF domain-containing protein
MTTDAVTPLPNPVSPVTRLPIRGPALVVVRFAWLALAVFSVGLFVAAMPNAYYQLIIEMPGPIRVAAIRLDLSLEEISGFLLGLEGLLVLVSAGVAVAIFWARSDDWLALLFSTAFLSFGPTIIGRALGAYELAYPEWSLAVSVLRGLGGGAILFVLYLFPDGQFVPRWTRLTGLLLLLWLFAYMFFPVQLPNPDDLPLLAQMALNFFFWSPGSGGLEQVYTSFRQLGFSIILAGWFVTGVYAQYHRFQSVSTPVQRQQTKWIVVGVSVALAGTLVWFLPQLIFPVLAHPVITGDGAASLLYNLLGLTILTVCLMVMPLAFALSILHFRLWDVDELISRALVYGGMMGLVGVMFFGLVYVLQWLLLWFTGQSAHVDVATSAIIVAASLVMALLFRPLAGRAQNFVDRSFYREKVDYRRAFTDFAREIRTIIELPDLMRVLLHRTTSLLHISHGAVFLCASNAQGGCDPARFELAEAFNVAPDLQKSLTEDEPTLQRLQAGQSVYRPKDKLFSLVVPLIAPQGSSRQMVGALALGPRLSGQDYSRDEQAMLVGLADQAGVAIYVARLIKEKEAEARRLEEVEQRLAAHRSSPLGRAEVMAEAIVVEPHLALVKLYALAQSAGHDGQAAALIGNLPQVFDNLQRPELARLAEGFDYVFTSPLTPEVLPVGLRTLAVQLDQIVTSGENLEAAAEAREVVRICQAALEASSIPQITAWAAGQLPESAVVKMPGAPPLFKLYRALSELLAAAKALRAYEHMDAPQDKLAYLAGAVERLGRVERVARNELGSADRPVIQRIAENWLAVVTGAMSELQTRAQLMCELLTRHTWQGETIAVALNIRNEGRGAALNLKVSLAPSPDYSQVDSEAEVPRLAPGEEVQVELRVRPRRELGVDRFRARFVILYADPRGVDQVENFADVVHLMAMTSDYQFIPNPYVVGTPLQAGSPLFIGREDVVTFIQENLAAAHRNNLVLIGQRRTGKSSLLKQLPGRLGESYVPVYLDGQALGLDPGLPNFFLTLATEIAFALEDRQLSVTPPDLSDFVDSPAAAFERKFLGEVRAAIGDRHLLLLLDEFEELEAAVRRKNLDPTVFGFLRHLIQHTENLSVIFCGTHRLEELAADYWNVLFNISLYRHVGFLEQPEAARLMQEPVAPYGMRYDDLALDKIWRVTAGHPYFLQLLCHSMVNRHNKTLRSYVTVADVNAALDEILASGEAHFVYLWTEANAAEKLTLTVLSRLGAASSLVTPVEIADYLTERGVKVERPAVTEALRRLTLRDILKAGDALDPTLGEAYRWKLGLLGLWVEKYKSLSHVVGEINAADPGR